MAIKAEAAKARKREKNRAWRAANKERVAQYNAQYKAEHKEEIRASAALWKEKNNELIRTKQKQWREDHKEHKQRYAKEYQAANRERELARMKEYREQPEIQTRRKTYAAQYNRLKRTARTAAEQERKANKKQAIPGWFSEFDALVMLEAADLCQLRAKTTGIKWHIDHIVPLVSSRVCGLHIGCNIQVIPAVENQAKGNRHWPDMP